MRGWRLWAVLAMLVAAGGAWWQMRNGGDAELTVALLLSDETDIEHPVVTAWLGAAREEGIPLTPVRASDFLRPMRLFRTDYAGVILPDTVHRVANDALLERLREYVDAGGKLMVVYDAATLTMQERSYPALRSRLSGLVGVDYALYGQLRDHTIVRGEVVPAAPGVRGLLRLPPDEEGETRTLRRGDGPSLSYSLHLGQWMRSLGRDPHDAARYAHFVTRGDYAGQRLLNGDDGQLLAGLRHAGKGSVAFVNLNLGWLKALADGALLHGFLHWFAAEVCDLPRFAEAPVPASAHLKTTLILNQEAYPAHLTAGPDFGTAQ